MPSRPRAASSVGIRELKNEASAILRRVRRGETLTVTDRNEAIALLVPLARVPGEETLRQLVATGKLAWSGGKPVGSTRPPTVRGAPVSAAVVEDRR